MYKNHRGQMVKSTQKQSIALTECIYRASSSDGQQYSQGQSVCKQTYKCRVYFLLQTSLALCIASLAKLQTQQREHFLLNRIQNGDVFDEYTVILQTVTGTFRAHQSIFKSTQNSYYGITDLSMLEKTLATFLMKKFLTVSSIFSPVAT